MPRRFNRQALMIDVEQELPKIATDAFSAGLCWGRTRRQHDYSWSRAASI